MNYKLNYLFIVFLLLGFSMRSKAQNSNSPSIKLDSIEVGMEADMHSASAVNNAMLNASGFINNDLKDENLARLGNFNQGGAFANLKMFYRSYQTQLWGLDRLSYYFALEWKTLNEYQFTKDLYQLTFYGNKSFEGEYAELDGTGYYQINYFQIKAGLRRHSENKRHYFGLDLALNLGTKLLGFKFHPQSYLFTNPKGTALTLQTNVGYLESDTAKTSWYNVSGVGASFDFSYKFIEKDRYSFLVTIDNIGFIKWNKKTINFSEDKKHVFEGVEVDNVFDIPDPLINSTDTLHDYIYANSTQEASYILIPIDLKFYFQQYLYQKKIKLGFLTHIRLMSYMLPVFQLDATYKINDVIELGPVVSYGGYTQFNAGLKLQLNVNNFQIKLESRYLTGFAQHSFSGMGGFINFTYKI